MQTCRILLLNLSGHNYSNPVVCNYLKFCILRLLSLSS